MEFLYEVGSTLEDDYENVKMTFEESVKEDDKDENKTSQKKTKTHVVQSEVDVTIVKDAKSFIDKVI